MRTVLIACILFLNSFAFGTMDKDRGGGNSYRGKPLESYIRNPKELKPYKKYLKDLQIQFSSYGFFNQYFEHALSHKTWYFVPGPLHQLSPETIGSVVPTEQVALQGFDAVWIDSDLFEKMSTNDQANLILHEVLIDLKLLRLESMREQCLAVITRSESAYQCDDDSTVRYGKPSDLTPEDYEEVRKTVLDMRKTPKTATYEDIQDLFHRRHFSARVFPFEPKGLQKFMPATEAFELITSAYLSQAWPNSLYRFKDLYMDHPELENQPLNAPFIWTAQGSCHLDKFTYEQGRMKSRYRSQTGNQPPTDFNIDFEMPPSTSFFIGKDLSNTLDSRQKTFAFGDTMIQQAVPGKRSVGDRLITIVFLLGNDGGMDGVHLIERVILREGDSLQNGERTRQVHDGLDEICSVRPKISFVP